MASADKTMWQESLSLDYDVEKLKNHYNSWENDYDKDMQQINYTGPQYMANYLNELYGSDQPIINGLSKNIDVLDVGCGTGALGKNLYQLGFKSIDGFDNSEKMINKAKELGVYNNFICGDIYDKKHSKKTSKYDLVVSCGVFTLGHIYPKALDSLINFTKNDGLIFIAVREDYYMQHNFAEYYKNLVQKGSIALIDQRSNEPYTREYNAMYLLFKRTGFV